jgi:DNA-binding MarR family transcriptional regulator
VAPERDELAPDLVERALASWQTLLPGVDLSPISVIARLVRTMGLLEPELEATLQRFGLNRASFDTLSALRRGGPPYQLSARKLADSCMRTSATLSARIARLTNDGLVTREPDPKDARSVLVTLTERGREVIDAAAPVYLAAEDSLLSGITDEQRAALADLLHALLLSLEGSAEESDGGPGDPVPVLGLRLESVPVAMRRRRAVALPDRVGLLVSATSPNGPAAAAGIVVGDLVAAVSGRVCRSVAQLNHMLASTKLRTLPVTIVRGNDERQLRIALDSARQPVSAARTG